MDDKDKKDEKEGGNSDGDGTQKALEPSPPPRAEETLRATEKQVLSKKKVKPKSVKPVEPPPSQYRTSAEPPTSPTPKRQQQQALEPGTPTRTSAEASLRSTEKQVLSKKQAKPKSVKPTQPAPAQYKTSSGETPPPSPRPPKQQALEPGTPTRSAAEANLRSTEKQVLAKKQAKPKSVKPVEPAPSKYRTGGETPPQSPRSPQRQALEPPSPSRTAAEANLRTTERQVLSKKQAKPKSVKATEPAPSQYRTSGETPPVSPRAPPSSTAEANLRSAEKQVLSKRQSKAKTKSVTPREPPVSPVARSDSSIARKVAANAASSPGNVLHQIAPDMRARHQQASPSSSKVAGRASQAGARASPVAALDRRILSKSSPRGGEAATLPPPVGPDGESVSTKRLREMLGEEEFQRTQAGQRTNETPATGSVSVAMGIPEPPLTQTTSTHRVRDTSAEDADYQHALAVSAEPPSAYTSVAEPRSTYTTAEPPSTFTAGASSEIQAFVAEPVPQVAMPVDLDEEEEEESKFRKRLLVVGGCVCIVAVAVVVAVVVAAGGKSSSPAVEPSPPPTASPTLSPTSGNVALLIPCLASAAGTEQDQLMNDRGSPQFEGAAWLADVDTFDGVSIDSCNQQLLERYALATFYFAADGPNWRICNEIDPSCTRFPNELGWLSANSVCDWFGVSCNGSMQVNRVDFNAILGSLALREQIFLSGTLPRDLGILSDMTYFSAFGFDLRGSIEGLFSGWPEVEVIDLNDNLLTGQLPGSLDLETPSLLVLDLSENQFEGQIPSSLGGLAKLELLDLGGNKLEGKINPRLGNLGSLLTLNLQENMLTGELPTEIYSLAALKRLSLDDNADLGGDIAPGIAGLGSLQRLNVDRTQMGGLLPPDFFWNQNLEVFSARECSFTGAMVPEQWLNLTELRELFLDFNDFSGPFPDVFNDLPDLELLWLPGNRLTGTLPSRICAARGTVRGEIQQLVVNPDNRFPDCCCDSCLSVEDCDSLGLS